MARKKKSQEQQPAAQAKTAEQLSDTDLQALFFQHKTAIAQKLAAKKAADAAFKNACKLAKAELGKNAVEDIKLATELESDEGEALLKDRIERQLRVARWMGAAVGSQFEMFDGEDRTPTAERARAAGKRAGLSGELRKPPHDPSTEQYREWMAGYDEGQEALVRQTIKAPAETKDGGPVPREQWAKQMRAQNERAASEIAEAGRKLGTQAATHEVVQ